MAAEVPHVSQSVWRGLAACILAAVGIYVTLPAWRDIVHIAATDPEASQIWLVPIVVAWLVWVRRERIKQIHLRTSLLGPGLLALAWGLSWWGFYHDIDAFWHAGAVLALVGCLTTFLGPEVIKRFWPAFVILIFLIPVPGMIRQRMAIPMQSLAASAAAFVLGLLGSTVHLNGSVLIYRGQEIAVAQACNGMRMVFALILVAFAVAFAMPLRPWMRWVIIVVSPLAALVCNVIRLVPTVWVYGWYPYAIGNTFHEVAGWVMLVVALALLLGLISVLRWAHVPVDGMTIMTNDEIRMTNEIPIPNGPS